MALPKIKEARDLPDQDLSQEILEAKKKLANLRLLQATGRLEKTHEFKHTRHWLAQLLTVEGERQRQTEVVDNASETTQPESTPSSTEAE